MAILACRETKLHGYFQNKTFCLLKEICFELIKHWELFRANQLSSTTLVPDTKKTISLASKMFYSKNTRVYSKLFSWFLKMRTVIWKNYVLFRCIQYPIRPVNDRKRQKRYKRKWIQSFCVHISLNFLALKSLFVLTRYSKEFSV